MADTGEKSYIAKESTLQTVLTKLDTLSTKSDMTTLQDSVTSSLSSVGGAVKSVQRGVKHLAKSKTYTDIAISAVTTSKSTVNVNVNGAYILYQSEGSMTITKTSNVYTESDASYQRIVDAVLTSSTNLRIFHTESTMTIPFVFWEVIEFN